MASLRSSLRICTGVVVKDQGSTVTVGGGLDMEQVYRRSLAGAPSIPLKKSRGVHSHDPEGQTPFAMWMKICRSSSSK